MAGDKSFDLSIVLSTLDRASAKLDAVRDRIARKIEPIRRLQSAVMRLGVASGIPSVVDGFGRVGRAALSAARQIAGLFVAFGVGAAGIKSIVSDLDDLDKSSKAIGVSADALAQFRFAAGQSGASVQELDSGLLDFQRNIGMLAVGKGRLGAFLDAAAPAFKRQLIAAETTEEAFDLVADAIVRVKDPIKQTALATTIFGGAGKKLLPLLKEGGDGVKRLRDEYVSIAGSQGDATVQAALLQDSFGRISAATGGLKAALLNELAPSILRITEGIKQWVVDNRPRIAEFFRAVGEKLPDAVNAAWRALSRIGRIISRVWDAIGGFSGAIKVVAALISGKLIMAIASLSATLLTTPFGWVLASIAAVVLAITHWDEITDAVAAGMEAFASALSDIWGGIKSSVSDVFDGLADYFESIWDSIVGVFEAAWKKIEAVIGKITAAARGVRDVVSSITDPIQTAGGGTGGVAAMATSILESRRSATDSVAAAANRRNTAQQTAGEARVTVAFTNAPQGTRVSSDRRNTADVDLSVGYQMP